MFAVEPGLLGPNLQALGRSLKDSIKAIVIVSPHWRTLSPKVTTGSAPETIHDFGGFPDELYQLQYPVNGDPILANEIIAMLNSAGQNATGDALRGLDHGAWVPLRYLMPRGDIPVVQVSLPHRIDTKGAYELGRVLGGLRQKNVLIIGSGSLTHNLYEFRQHISDPEYAQEFADWVRDAVETGNADALINYRSEAPHAARAHPTEEHYLPLLVAMGAADESTKGSLVKGGMTYGTLSMDSFLFS